MDDQRKRIGSAGRAGRGNKSVSPSSAARSLAAGTPGRRAPAKKAAAKKPAVKKAAAKNGPAKKAAAEEPTVKSAAKTSATKAKTAQSSAESGKSRATNRRHLRAVTADDAKAAAQTAASLADKNALPNAPKIPLEEIVAAVIGGFQRVMGSQWESRLATLLHVIRKRLSGNYQVDEFGFDEQVFAALHAAMEPLAEKWFRLTVQGVENIPTEGGALLVSNHSGTIPLDGLMTGYAVQKYTGRHLRPLAADLVFSLPVVSSVARKAGATLACTQDAERLLKTGELAGVWPEGFKGIGKPFAERYKLQRFGRGGFVSSALQAQVPIIPVSIVGAEEIYPLVGNVPSLARLLGLPYLPITPLFPLLGPLGLIPLPSKWIIEFGEPIRTDAYEPEAADDPMLLFNVTDQVRETIQQTLYRLLTERKHAFI